MPNTRSVIAPTWATCTLAVIVAAGVLTGIALFAPDARARAAGVNDIVETSGQEASGQEASAAELKEHRKCERNPRAASGQFGGHKRGRPHAALAEVIGIDASILREALRSGQSLAAIAGDNGVDPEVVIAAIVESIAERVEAKVADGALDSAKAALILDNAEDKARRMVQHERGSDEHRPARSGKASRAHCSSTAPAQSAV